MVKFYLKFEDIQRDKCIEVATIQAALDMLIPSSVHHMGYAHYWLGEVKPILNDIYMVVERLTHNLSSRRRGYIQVPEGVSFPDGVEAFVPDVEVSFRRMLREARDGLLIEGVIRRLGERVPADGDEHLIGLLDQISALVDPLRMLMREVVVILEGKRRVETIRASKQSRKKRNNRD